MEQPKRMTAYITKYALTIGIYKVDATEVDGATIMVKEPSGMLTCYHCDQWWKSPVLAKQHADIMRLKKIESLKKQIKKLENLRF